MNQITLAELEVGKQYTGKSHNGNTTSVTISSIQKRGDRYRVDIISTRHHVERNEFNKPGE
jgi:hypothetical protein